MKKIYLLLLLLISVTFAQNSMLTLTSDNYEKKLQENKRTIVMFSAPWCGACKEMKPIYEEMATNHEGDLVFASIDTDDNEAASSDYNIKSIPTTILFENGKEVRRKSGSLLSEDIMMFIDFEKSIEADTKKCNDGDAQTCMDLADIYEDGEEVIQDYLQVFNFTKKACELNHLMACNNLGYIYGNAEGVELDGNLAVKYYGIACDGEESLGCQNLGGLYKEGWYEMEKDYKKSFDYFTKACAIDNDPLAHYELGNLYQEGLGREQNPTKAEEHFKIACDAEYDDACKALGIEQNSEEIDDPIIYEDTTSLDTSESNLSSYLGKFVLFVLAIYLIIGLIVFVFSKNKKEK